MAFLISSSVSALSRFVPSSIKTLVVPEENERPRPTALIAQTALSIPKTIFDRFTGSSICPQWALHEEVMFNAIRIVASNSDGAKPLLRSIGPRLIRLQSLLCSERIEPVEARDISGGLVKGYWIGSPVNYTTEVTILYIHGGAFVAGHPLQSCHGLADLLHVLFRERGIIARIFALQYPLAPEHPYPAALEASVRAVQWLIDSVGARKLFLMGDSAGGNLSLATLLYIRDHLFQYRYLHNIQGCIPISPFVDFLGPRSPPDFSASGEPSSELDSSDEKFFGSNADFLGLPTGRVAVRYYLGTKANGWYEQERAWPNPWNKTQWDGGWLKAWDGILGITPRTSARRSPMSTPIVSDRDPTSASESDIGAIQVRGARKAAIDEARAKKLRRLSKDESVIKPTVINKTLSGVGFGDVDISMKDLDDVQSDADSVLSTDSGKSVITSWQRRYSFVSERGGLSLASTASATQQFSGVPFPDLETVDKPYHANRELSSYDLERIYLTLALTPYVSPYRAQSFDNLPPLLFLAGQRELLYGDIVKCVRKARRSVALADMKLSEAERMGRPRGFGRVDFIEEPLGVHVYLLLPETLVGGKGMEGLRDIAGWIADVLHERKMP